MDQLIRSLRTWINTPASPDAFTALRIRFVNIFILANYAIFIFLIPLIALASPDTAVTTLGAAVALLAITTGARVLLTSGRLRIAEGLILGYLLTVGTIRLFQSSLDAHEAAPAFTVLLVLAVLLLRRRGALLVAAYVIGMTLFVTYATTLGWIPYGTQRLSPSATAIVQSTTYLAVVVFIYLFVTNLRASLRQARDELHRRERLESRYRSLFDSAQDMIISVDLDGRLILANPAFERLLGWSAAEWVGQPALGLIASEDVPRAEAMGAALQASGTAVPPAELRLRHRDGRILPFEFSFSVQHDEDGPIILSFARNLTERRRAEAMLREAQKLDSLGMLAGGIAHDFNNLLVGMLGQISLTQSSLPPGSPGETSLRKAADAAEHAADITRQLLAYSGQGQFARGPLDLNELIEDNTALFGVAIAKHIVLHTDPDPALPPMEADRVQMQQVIMNLVLNAAQAIGDEKGSITVTTDLQTLTAANEHFGTHTGRPLPPGRYVVLQVSDTGPGMDAATLARIFDPFFTTKTSGTGLGLPAVLGTVRGHSGGIHVTSAPGRGSTFTLLFPASDAPLPAPQPSAGPVPELSGTLLVIDDEEPVREAVSDILTPQGVTVLAAASGEAGLQLLRAHSHGIDLVLLDLTMPGMSGEEVLRVIRAEFPDLPVLLSSGYSEQEATQHLADAMTGFLQKPYNMATLTATLDRYL